MAFTLRTFWAFQDGESGDNTCERYLGTNVVVTTSRKQTGTYGYSHDYTLTGSQAIGSTTQGQISGGRHLVVSFAAGVSAAPSAAANLFVRKVSDTYYNHVTIGTDRKLRFYDKGGNQVGSASTTLIPTTGVQEVHIVFDGMTLSTVYIKVYFGGTEELAFDTGLSWANFFDEGVGEFYLGDPNNTSDKGFVLYSDDVVIMESFVAGDAVHLTNYPRLRGIGRQIPTAVGTHNQWDAPVGDATKYGAVDDSGTHDGDTTYVPEFDKGTKQTFTSTTANPIPSGATLDFVQLRNIGKLTTNKLGARFLLKKGNDERNFDTNSATPNSSYSGGLVVPALRPGGGTWVRADAEPGTIQFGWQSENDPSFDTGAQVTKQLGPHWIYPEANLAAGTTPVSASLVIPVAAVRSEANSLLRR